MKHCILVKFKPEISDEAKRAMVPEVEALFRRTLSIPGIRAFRLLPNCVARDNRADWMLQLEMDAEALPLYDACEAHKAWKVQYGSMLESKTIFDYED